MEPPETPGAARGRGDAPEYDSGASKSQFSFQRAVVLTRASSTDPALLLALERRLDLGSGSARRLSARSSA